MSSEIQKVIATNKAANATLDELNAQVCLFQDFVYEIWTNEIIFNNKNFLM